MWPTHIAIVFPYIRMAPTKHSIIFQKTTQVCMWTSNEQQVQVSSAQAQDHVTPLPTI